MRTKINNGWIFSKKEDLLVFYVPFLPTILIGLAIFLLDIEFNSFVRTGIILDFIVSAFLDYPHALSTVYRPLIADQAEAKRRKFLFLILPLILFSLVNIWDQIDRVSMLLIITYFNIFHLVRQQWGWMTISDRKINYFNKLDFHLSKFFLYTFTFGPILWWHSQDLAENIGFTAANDLPKFFSEKTGSQIAEFVFITFFIFLIYNLIKFFKDDQFNLNKFGILLSTFFAWAVGIIILRGEVVFIDISHAIPYLYLMFFYCKKVIKINREKGQNTTLKTFKTNPSEKPYNLGKKPSEGFLSFLQDQFFLKPYSVGIFMLYLIIPSLLSLYLKINFIENIFLSLALLHYIADGFIWRPSKKENSEIMKKTMNI
jgi:hypothetical protein